MDPDKHWEETVRIAKAIVAKNNENPSEAIDCDFIDILTMAENIVALNDWVSKGGFVPESFKRPSPTIESAW
jgi:hypothetical protein